MKRNLDLIRKIMLAVEEHEHGRAPDIEIPNYSEEQIGYHCHLIVEAGLADGFDTTVNSSQSPTAGLLYLTWEGHDFVDSARNPERWQAAKAAIEKVKGVSFAVLKALLVEAAKKSVGL